MGVQTNRTLWLDYLRTTITLMVIAHHSSLSYTTFASFDKEKYINSTHPVVDSVRWIGLDIFENFNDIFFMSLMFFIGGIFIVRSLQRKGVAVFIRDRFYWLFLPFLLLGTLFMLAAYYPCYYLAYGVNDLKEYVVDFFTVQQWPVGPPWFIWILFLFNLLFALCFPLIKNHLSAMGSFFEGLKDNLCGCLDSGVPLPGYSMSLLHFGWVRGPGPASDLLIFNSAESCGISDILFWVL